MKKGSIYIGTSGWSYKEWKSKYYPDNIRNKDWLSFYANDFSITEINSSFYRLPKASTVEKWLKQVPDNFIFCPKLSRYLTQMKKLNEPEEPLERFFSVFEPMKKKMGPVLAQLPPTLAYNEEKAEYFFNLLQEQYKAYEFSLEVRHESWLEAESIQMMKQYNIAFVVSQSKNKFPYAEHVTAEHIYVRFHGPNKLYGSKYSDEDLSYYASLFKKWKNAGHRVYAFFNNDMHGYAIGDTKRLIAMCE